MSANRKLKVFLCHANDDKPKVRKLYKRLVTDGFDAWLDEEKLIPGQDWEFEIHKALRNTDAIVACLSGGSVTKEGYIQKEIRLAQDLADEKPEGTVFLIPARLEDCVIPSRMNRYQRVNLFESKGYEKLKEALQLRMEDLNIRFSSADVSPKADDKGISIPVRRPIATGLALSDIQRSMFISEEMHAVEIARSLLSPKEKHDDLFALAIRGNSMIDSMINDGDIVIMRPVTIARNGEMVAVWLPNENTVLLRYFFKEKDGYRLQPANPTMKPIFIKKNEPLEIKGKVIMVIRKVDPL